jgi:hypothetical protein
LRVHWRARNFMSVSEGEPTSLKAVAIETGPNPTIARESSVEVPFARRPVPRRLKLIVGSVIVVCLGILCVGGIRFAARGKAPVATAPAATAPPIAKTIAPPPPPVAVVAAPAPPAAEPPVASLKPDPSREALKPPTPKKTATLKVAHGAKLLTVDGKKATGGSVVVTCGSHIVAVGKEKPHRVDAPCGATVVVDARKAKPAKSRH